MDASNIFIEKLNLRLPSGLQGRANTIARLTARQLALLKVSHHVNVDELSVPSLQIEESESNRAIARKIAYAVGQQIQHSQVHNRPNGTNDAD